MLPEGLRKTTYCTVDDPKHVKVLTLYRERVWLCKDVCYETFADLVAYGYVYRNLFSRHCDKSFVFNSMLLGIRFEPFQVRNVET